MGGYSASAGEDKGNSHEYHCTKSITCQHAIEQWHTKHLKGEVVLTTS